MFIRLNDLSDKAGSATDDLKKGYDGYDTEVRFTVGDNKITVITENAGVFIRNTAVLSDMSRPIYATVTGDQVAITNTKVQQA